MTKYEFVERLCLEIRLITREYQNAKKIKNLYAKSICDEFLSEEEYVQIVAFRRFIEREKELSDEQIKDMLLISKSEFPFIYNLVNCISSDVMDELRCHGAVSVAMMYKQRKFIDAKNKVISEKKKSLNPIR